MPDKEYDEALAELQLTDEKRRQREHDALIAAAAAEVEKVMKGMTRTLANSMYRPGWGLGQPDVGDDDE